MSVAGRSAEVLPAGGDLADATLDGRSRVQSSTTRTLFPNPTSLVRYRLRQMNHAGRRTS